MEQKFLTSAAAWGRGRRVNPHRDEGDGQVNHQRTPRRCGLVFCSLMWLPTVDDGSTKMSHYRGLKRIDNQGILDVIRLTPRARRGAD